MPTQDSWTAAGMSPCERTIRKRFGSFQAAFDEAGHEPMRGDRDASRSPERPSPDP
jgi:hypothetical protein